MNCARMQRNFQGYNSCKILIPTSPFKCIKHLNSLHLDALNEYIVNMINNDIIFTNTDIFWYKPAMLSIDGAHVICKWLTAECKYF